MKKPIIGIILDNEESGEYSKFPWYAIRKNYLQDLPVQLWGSLIDRYIEKSEYTGWNLLNSATDELWHKEKPTVASYNHNATIVDGLCNWIQA